MKKTFIIISIVFIILIGLGVMIYSNSTKPVRAAEEVAVQKAKAETDLKTVDDFYLYNGNETTYIIEGKDDQNVAVFVWVPEKKGDVIIQKQSEGITKEEAVQKLLEEKNPTEIISISLGLENNIPLWEILYRTDENLINYYLVDFATGDKKLKIIENL